MAVRMLTAELTQKRASNSPGHVGIIDNSIGVARELRRPVRLAQPNRLG